MKRHHLISVLSLLILAGAMMAFAYRVSIREAFVEARRTELPIARPYVPPTSEVADETVSEETAAPEPADEDTTAQIVHEGTPSEVVLSEHEVNLSVPFTSQAPTGNWDLPFQEACEETSLLMVNAWMVGTPADALEPKVVERLIRNLAAWEVERFGYYEDTTAEETATIAREFYGYAHTEVLPVNSIEDVKRKIAEGHAVLLPASGKDLGNPYFSGEGPLYHMLVAKGYTEDGRIITNDPGTRRGADFLYDPDTLFDAIGDWNDGNPSSGEKLMIILKP